jgi:hypothetical protein
LWEGVLSSELVINVVKSDEEVRLIAAQGVTIIQLRDIVAELNTENFIINSASGADFIDLIHMGAKAKPC